MTEPIPHNNPDVLQVSKYVTIHSIGGDIYICGEKKAFAVDFNVRDPKRNELCENVDWLIAWAKVGLISRGHTVPDFKPQLTSAGVPISEGAP